LAQPLIWAAGAAGCPYLFSGRFTFDNLDRKRKYAEVKGRIARWRDETLVAGKLEITSALPRVDEAKAARRKSCGEGEINFLE
jgi:hypothetical protein